MPGRFIKDQRVLLHPRTPLQASCRYRVRIIERVSTMLKRMQFLDKAMEYAAALLMFSLFMIVFIQVVFRYVIQASLPWTEEMARYLFVWLIFVTTSLCVRKQVHLGIDFLTVRFPDWVQRHLYILSLILSLIFSIFVVMEGYDLLSRSGNQISPMLHIPMSFVYVVIPLSYATICLLLLVQIVQSLRNRHPDH